MDRDKIGGSLACAHDAMEWLCHLLFPGRCGAGREKLQGKRRRLLGLRMHFWCLDDTVSIRFSSEKSGWNGRRPRQTQSTTEMKKIVLGRFRLLAFLGRWIGSIRERGHVLGFLLMLCATRSRPLHSPMSH